jgi:hypothetical protein
MVRDGVLVYIYTVGGGDSEVAEPMGRASNIQTPGIYPKESELHLQHGENSNLKSCSSSL